MGIFRTTKNVAGRIVDVRVDKWVSWEYLTETADRFRLLLVDVVVPKKATYSETFSEALERLEINEEDIEQRKQEFTRLFYFFLIMSVGIIIYGLIMAFRGGMVASLISFCLSLYTLSQAFRFHFWLFQVKHRKLGCTLKEWFNSEIISEPGKELVPKSESHMKRKSKRKVKE